MKIRDRIKELRRVPGSQLAPNPKNWRTHPAAQLDALRGVLAEVGFAGAHLARELADGSLQLIDGHARAEIVGDAVVPVLVTDLTEQEADKILATFDPIGAMAGADKGKLADLMESVRFDSPALEAMLDSLKVDNGILADRAEVQDDEIPEPPAEPITKLGDLWLLGEHRLLCGDSTKAEDVARLMNGERAVLLSTDPPYGVSFQGANYNPTAKEWAPIANDDRTGDDLQSWLGSVWSVWLQYVTDDFAFYCWTAAKTEQIAAAAAAATGIHIQSQIIWVKNVFALGQADYQWCHENCLYGFFKGKKHRWFGGRDKRTTWMVNRVHTGDYEHPTQKPVELFAIPMRHHTNEKELVAEPFSGSGSQIIAAEQLGRRCYAMELSPVYVDVAVKRWENLTGKKAQRDV